MDNREMSIKQAITTPEAINASFDKLERIRNAERNAPWLPDNPPKNPLNNPPNGKYFLSNSKLAKAGMISKQEKKSKTIAMISLMGTITNKCSIRVYENTGCMPLSNCKT